MKDRSSGHPDLSLWRVTCAAGAVVSGYLCSLPRISSLRLGGSISESPLYILFLLHSVLRIWPVSISLFVRRCVFLSLLLLLKDPCVPDSLLASVNSNCSYWKKKIHPSNKSWCFWPSEKQARKARDILRVQGSHGMGSQMGTSYQLPPHCVEEQGLLSLYPVPKSIHVSTIFPMSKLHCTLSVIVAGKGALGITQRSARGEGKTAR